MRILVTGVTGQIGGALLSRLPASATTIAADRSMLNLAAPQAIPATLDRLAPDIIINPAAYTAVDKAEDEPDACHAGKWRGARSDRPLGRRA